LLDRVVVYYGSHSCQSPTSLSVAAYPICPPFTPELAIHVGFPTNLHPLFPDPGSHLGPSLGLDPLNGGPSYDSSVTVRMSNHTESPTLPPPGKYTCTPLGATSSSSTRISVSPGAFTAGADASPVPVRIDKFESPVGDSNSPIVASWRRHTTTPP